MSQKQCYTCKEFKDYSEFHKDRVRPDGHYPTCKTCRLAKIREVYPQNREKLLYKQKLIYQKNSEKIKRRVAARKEAFPEKVKESDANYYRVNRIRLNEAHKKYYRKDIESSRADHRRRYRENPERYKLNATRRKARIFGNGGFHTLEEWEELLKLHNNTCLCCGVRGEDTELGKLTIDHIIPISKGGTDNINNIQPLCRDCNNRKYLKTIDYRPH